MIIPPARPAQQMPYPTAENHLFPTSDAHSSEITIAE